MTRPEPMSQTALVLIDFQNDYFQGGAYPLVGTSQAAVAASRVLTAFRERGNTVVHVRHASTEADATFFVPGTHGAEINAALRPLDSETVVTKTNINAFLGTGLQDILDAAGTREVVAVGAMSHMCVDAFVRAAADFGYQVTVLHDAVATRDLDFDGRQVLAQDVQAAFMSALAFAYARVIATEDYLSSP